MSRGQDDLHRRPTVTNAGGELHAVHASRHIDVGKDDPNILATLQNADRFVGVGCFNRLEIPRPPPQLPP